MAGKISLKSLKSFKYTLYFLIAFVGLFVLGSYKDDVYAYPFNNGNPITSAYDSGDLYWVVGGTVSGYPINQSTGEWNNTFSSTAQAHYTGATYSNKAMWVGSFGGSYSENGTNAIRNGYYVWTYAFGNYGGAEYARYSTDSDGNSYPECDSDSYWAYFDGCTFNNVHIECHFPVAFNNCTFNNSVVDSRGSHDIVMYNCRVYGGKPNSYSNGGVIYTANNSLYNNPHIGHHIMLSKTTICDTGSYTATYNPMARRYSIIAHYGGTANTRGSVRFFNCNVSNTKNSQDIVYLVSNVDLYVYNGNTFTGTSKTDKDADFCYIEGASTAYVYGSSFTNYPYIFQSRGTINMSNGSMNNAYCGIKNEGTVNMSGGTISSVTYGVNNSGNVNMSGGTISDTSYGIYSTNYIVLSNGTIKNNTSHGIYNNGVLEMSGGSITNSKTGIGNYHSIYATGGSVKNNTCAIEHNGAEFKVSGTFETENKADDSNYVYLHPLKYIEINDEYNGDFIGNIYLAWGGGNTSYYDRMVARYIFTVTGKWMSDGETYKKGDAIEAKYYINKFDLTFDKVCFNRSYSNPIWKTTEIREGNVYNGFDESWGILSALLTAYYVNGFTPDFAKDATVDIIVPTQDFWWKEEVAFVTSQIPTSSNDQVHFVGWSIENKERTTCTKEITVWPAYQAEDDVTWYAIWGYYYHIVYDPNLGEGDYPVVTVENVDDVIIPNTPTRDGYEPIGWQIYDGATEYPNVKDTDPRTNENDDYYNMGDELGKLTSVPESTVTLVAIWKHDHEELKATDFSITTSYFIYHTDTPPYGDTGDGYYFNTNVATQYMVDGKFYSVTHGYFDFNDYQLLVTNAPDSNITAVSYDKTSTNYTKAIVDSVETTSTAKKMRFNIRNSDAAVIQPIAHTHCDWYDAYTDHCDTTFEKKGELITVMGDCTPPIVTNLDSVSEYLSTGLLYTGSKNLTIEDITGYFSGYRDTSYLLLTDEDTGDDYEFKGTEKFDTYNRGSRDLGNYSITYLNNVIDSLGAVDHNMTLSYYLEDNVGNVSSGTTAIQPFELNILSFFSVTYPPSQYQTIGGESVISFKRGEAAEVTVETTGYADVLRVEFPSEWNISESNPLYIYFDQKDFYEYENMVKCTSNVFYLNTSNDARGIWDKSFIFIVPYYLDVPYIGNINFTAYRRQVEATSLYTISLNPSVTQQKSKAVKFYVYDESTLDDVRTHIEKTY